MKTNFKLKFIILLLGGLSLAFMSCGHSAARPASGFDVSILSPMLSIGPKLSEGNDQQPDRRPEAAGPSAAPAPANPAAIPGATSNN